MSRTLYLIDGYAQIFRAFYAIRNGMNSPVTGEPTHAVFGFTGMLLKLLTQHQPDFVVVAIDHPEPTFRDELYSSYKGTRNETPADLKVQVPRVEELLGCFNIPVVSPRGLEADDAIATIVHRVLADPELVDVRIRMISKDKDLEQLLCDRVTLYDIHTDAELDVQGLWDAKGIRPEQVIDLLALTGDTVDNVPGVEGIGTKTAALLLQQFGSIDGIYAHIDAGGKEIKGKRKENLEKGRAQLPLSRKLVTLTRDAEFPFDLESARVRPCQPTRLIPLFQQLGFNRYQDDVRRLAAAAFLDSTVSEPVPPLAEPSAQTSYPDSGAIYTAVTTREQLDELAQTLRQQPLIAFDTETTGLERDARLAGLSFSWQAAQGVYVPVRSPEPESHLDEATVLSVLGPLLEDATLLKCGHNLKFDARVLLQHGVCLRGVVFDSFLAMALLDPQQPAGLDAQAANLLGYRMIPLTSLLGESKSERTIDQVPLDLVTAYAAEDADLSLQLRAALLPRLEEKELLPLLQDLEAPLTLVLADMEHNGILCDPAELRRQGAVLGKRAAELKEEIQTVAGGPFGVDSPKQLAEVLFDRLGYTPVKTTKTGRSTDQEVLERLSALEDRNVPHTAVPRLVLEYRQLAKLISTYLGNLEAAIDPATGRIHSTFHQLVTATGRIASHNPNLQNIPIRSDIGRQIRKAFPASPGHCLLCADYSQIELRLLAHLSGDPALQAAFAREEDIHAAVASQVFEVPIDTVTREQRSQAKTINFGIIYGISAFGLARRIEGLEQTAAARLIADYKERFPGIERFLQECVQQALSHGYVTTLLGRRRAIPEIHAPTRTQRNLGERLAINTVVQGSAADLIKRAMLNLHRRIDRDRLPLRLLVQIHDELVFETPEAGAEELALIVREEMERAMTLTVPLRAEAGIGPDWLSAK